MTVLKIDFKSPQHAKLLEAILARKTFSAGRMAQRYEHYKAADEQFIAFMPERELDKNRKKKRSSEGVPEYTTLQIPYSYAILMTIHTYLTSVFLGRSPILQFSGRHSASEHAVRAVEALMDYQTQIGEHIVPYYLFLLDGEKYGLGIIGTYWAEEYETVSSIQDVPRTIYGIEIPGKKVKKKITKQVRGYVGNRAYNVRPQNFFPDPRVPISQLQKGEFCGRDVDVSWNTMLKRKEGGTYYNLEHIQSNGMDHGTGSSQVIYPSIESSIDIKGTKFVNLLEMFIELSPRDWGLGEGTSPEKWVFTVANDRVIVSAQPLGLDHNKYPFQTYEPEILTGAFLNRGSMEIMEPLNNAITWLVNSHFYNVRKTLNNELFIDPSRFEVEDLMAPGPGRLIRATPQAYGTRIADAVHQLQSVDVTRSHIGDTQFMSEVLQRIMGVNDNIMGMLDGGGRKTATEVRTSSSFGVNRMKTKAEFLSAQSFAPLASMLLRTTQQMYDDELSFRIAGNQGSMREGLEYLKVTSGDIAGAFDFTPIDGTMPVDRFALANVWRELMVQGQQVPAVAQSYDFAKIFGYVGELLGAKNLDRFRIQVVADDTLDKSAMAGNSIPLGGANEGNGEGGAGGFPLPRQTPGMGPVG